MCVCVCCTLHHGRFKFLGFFQSSSLVFFSVSRQNLSCRQLVEYSIFNFNATDHSVSDFYVAKITLHTLAPTTTSFSFRTGACFGWACVYDLVVVVVVVFARMIVCVHKMFCLILYEYDWIIIIMRRCQCASLSMRACVWNVWYIKENAERRWSDDSLAMFFSFCSFEPKLFGSWTKYT